MSVTIADDNRFRFLLSSAETWDHVQGLVRYLKDTGRLPRGGSPKDQPSLFDDKTKT